MNDQSKMNQIRAQLDAQSEYTPAEKAFSEKEIDKTIQGEISRVYSEKKGINNNMRLAKMICDLNPDLPNAFKAKFEVMSINAHFATNVAVVISDCEKNGIKLKMSETGTVNTKIEKIGD